jgi:hypothetical protein
MFLLPVVDGHQGLLDEGSHPRPEVGLACSISASAVPDARIGITTSLRHQAVSVSAIRRRLSP